MDKNIAKEIAGAYISINEIPANGILSINMTEATTLAEAGAEFRKSLRGPASFSQGAFVDDAEIIAQAPSEGSWMVFADAEGLYTPSKRAGMKIIEVAVVKDGKIEAIGRAAAYPRAWWRDAKGVVGIAG